MCKASRRLQNEENQIIVNILRFLATQSHDFQNPYTTIPFWMGGLYSGITILILIYFLLFLYFKELEIEQIWRLGDTGFFMKLFGVYIRVAPIIVKTAHYLILILICSQIYELTISYNECGNIAGTQRSGGEYASELQGYTFWSIPIYIVCWVRFELQ